jgi:hypothetical protein
MGKTTFDGPMAHRTEMSRIYLYRMNIRRPQVKDRLRNESEGTAAYDHENCGMHFYTFPPAYFFCERLALSAWSRAFRF